MEHGVGRRENGEREDGRYIVIRDVNVISECHCLTFGCA